MDNPSIDELRNPEKFELIAQLDHSSIKEFVIQQLQKGGKLINSYMIYQTSMIVLLAFITTLAIIKALNDYSLFLYYILGALVFCFSFLIVIHELLHGIAIKLTGAPKVNYGAILHKFIFYAEADRHVLNRTQFRGIALAPFIVIKILTLGGIIVFWNHPALYFFVFVMAAHSFFCAGDIGLLSLFYKHGNNDVFTYDERDKKRSYYYKRI